MEPVRRKRRRRRSAPGFFVELVERHRHELRVHCYRMLGAFDEAEDLVQETFLRAWRRRAQFEGRSSVRARLYRIATNACLDSRPLQRDRPVLREQLPQQRAEWAPTTGPTAAEQALLQRYMEAFELVYLTA